MNIQRVSKAIAAGVAGGVAAFVPLAAGATKWAIGIDVAAAVAAGVVAAVSTYFAPPNTTKP